MPDQPEGWWREFDFDEYDANSRTTTQVDDVAFVQPVGFVWFQKPRYRVKARSVRR